MATHPDPLLSSPAQPRSDAFGAPPLTPVLSWRDPSFSPSDIGVSNLAVELHARFLRVAVVDARQNRCRLLEEFTLSHPGTDEPPLHDVRDLMNGYDLLTRNFWQSVHLVVNNQSFTLVPDGLFRKEYAVRYLELARSTSLAAEKVHFAPQPRWNAVTVFSLPARLDDWLQGLYPFEKLRLFHPVDALLTLALNAHSGSEKRLLALLENESVSLVYHDGPHLVYANRFAFRTLNDLAYYLLFALEELSLDPEALDAQVWGQFEPDDETHRTLREYLPRVRVGDPPPALPSGEPVLGFSPHRYAGLLSLASLA